MSYRHPGLVLGIGGAAPEGLVRGLQRDLRILGYLRRGIDGRFGPATRRAVMALQHDLLHNDGRGRAGDGDAPVRVIDYNRGRVAAVSGLVDQDLVECISELLDEPRFPHLPASPDPGAENRRIARELLALPPSLVPTAFLVAVLRQQTGLRHYAVPRGEDEDNFLLLGTHHDGAAPYAITSRGYGIGQHPLFHHPPRPEELSTVLLVPAKNVQSAARRLREKFDAFVQGPGDWSDDRLAERGGGPLVRCRYAAGDPRYLRDCAGCVAAAGLRDVVPGLPLHPGSRATWEPTPSFPSASYPGVPARERLGCDWPYAVRRYFGGGLHSYHCQARVLQGLAELYPLPTPPPPARSDQPSAVSLPTPVAGGGAGR